MKPGKSLRMTPYGFNAGINSAKKFFTQTYTSFFIPAVGVNQILLRLRGDD
jgi:hypothetical protein